MVAWLFWFAFTTIIGMGLQAILRRKPSGPPKSSLEQIQIPTQAEGESFRVIFGTPARSAHTHVLYYGDLSLVAKEKSDQIVCYYHILTVHLGLCRSGPEAVQQIWYKDTPMWPTLRDETSSAADAQTSAVIDDEEHFRCFGDWRRDGGFGEGTAEILYGGSAQPENDHLRVTMGVVSGQAQIEYEAGIGWRIYSTVFAAQADGYWLGGKFACLGHIHAIIYHVGDEIRTNGGYNFWLSGNRSFLASPPSATMGHVPAFRGILSIVFPHFYWGISPVFGMVSFVIKRCDQLTDGTAQWYAAKADISGDLNPAHIVRECLTETTWGEGHATADLGTSWTTVADTLYSEGFGLSFSYLPEPGALQEFVDLVLEHIDGYLWKDRTTGKIEIGLVRDDYVFGDLEEYDQSDFDIIDWHTPTWRDICGRIVLQYSNRCWQDNAKTVIYDDLAVQAKQGDRVVEKKIDRPGIFTDVLAATVVNRLGRAMCRTLSLGTLKAKRTMSDLHRGSIFKLSYSDPDLAIVQMAVRVATIKYGPLGEDIVEIDVVEDIWGSAYTIYGSPGTPAWEAPGVEPDEQPLAVERITAAAAVTITNEGVGETISGSADAVVSVGSEGVT